VITKVGTPCYASIIEDYNYVALSRNVLGVKNIKNVNTYYLLIFLRSKYGFLQLHRNREITIQYKITLKTTKQIKVFLPSNDFQTQIELLAKSYIEKLNYSKTLYTEAEALLLQELDLENYQPNSKNTAEVSLSEMLKIGRMDAEYFQPKYAEFIEHLQNYKNGYKTLGELVSLHTLNITPDKLIKHKYIELSNIGNNGEITGFIYDVGENLPSRARYKIQKNQVILSSIEGSLSSIALVTEEYDGAFCSTGFYPISSETINSETLLIFFKTIAGQTQLKRGCNGTILTAINKDELLQITIPLIPQELQAEIAAKVQESHAHCAKKVNAC